MDRSPLGGIIGGGPDYPMIDLGTPVDPGGGEADAALHIGNPRKSGNEYLKVQDAFTRTLAFLDPYCEADLTEGYAAIVFNTASAFFNGTIPGTSGTLSVDNGKLRGGTDQAQVFIILHELSHAMGAKDFRGDFNNPENGKHNDDLIDTKCKKTLGAIR